MDCLPKKSENFYRQIYFPRERDGESADWEAASNPYHQGDRKTESISSILPVSVSQQYKKISKQTDRYAHINIHINTDRPTEMDKLPFPEKNIEIKIALQMTLQFQTSLLKSVLEFQRILNKCDRL